MFFVYFLITILPLADHHIFGEQYGPLTVFKYLGIFCFAYSIYYWTNRRIRPAFLATPQAWMFFGLVAIAMVSACIVSMFSSFPSQMVFSYVSFVLLLFVSLSVIDSPKRLNWILRLQVLAQVISSYYVLEQKFVEHAYRPGGAVGDSNYYALCALTAVPIAYCLCLDSKKSIERAAYGAALVVLLSGIAVSGSRGGFLGLCVAFLFLILKSSRPFRNICIAGGLLVPLMVLMPDSPVDRLIHPDYADNIGTDSRTTVWKAGFRMIEAHPLMGVGLGMFRNEVESYEDDTKVLNIAHNTYIEIAAELGLPALLIFLGMLAATYRTLDRLRKWTYRHGPSLYYQAVLSSQAALLGCVVGICFLTAQYQKNLWMVIFSSMYLPLLVQAHERQRRAQAASFRGAPEGATDLVCVP